MSSLTFMNENDYHPNTTKQKPKRRKLMDGLKKTFGKASQALTEKVGGNADRTEMDPQFKEMERQMDCTSKTVNDLLLLTREYLQPNSSMRGHLVSGTGYSKIAHGNRQRPEQLEEKLGKMMRRSGLELNESNFGTALVTVGEAMSQLADAKNSLDDSVKSEFLDPLQQLVDKDIKEVLHHRKKLNGRRLDYDYKRGKLKANSKGVTEEEVNQSYEKLEDSIQLAGTSMHNLLSNDVEQVAQLSQFVESMIRFHKECAESLEPIMRQLEQQQSSSGISKPMANITIRRDPMIVARTADPFETSTYPDMNSQHNNARATPVAPVRTPSAAPRKPSCQALYDFEPENPGELEFAEGDIISLTSQIDENWFEGEISGKTGFFPINYVKVLVPLN